jgi:hypothetical protein
LCEAFNKIHEGVDTLREIFDNEDDDVEVEDLESQRLFRALEKGALGPVHRLRLKYDVPYSIPGEEPEKEGGEIGDTDC